ncbi:24902_t:CDS:2, partial [Gigaspora rosea]
GLYGMDTTSQANRLSLCERIPLPALSRSRLAGLSISAQGLLYNPISSVVNSL